MGVSEAQTSSHRETPGSETTGGKVLSSPMLRANARKDAAAIGVGLDRRHQARPGV